MNACTCVEHDQRTYQKKKSKHLPLKTYFFIYLRWFRSHARYIHTTKCSVFQRIADYEYAYASMFYCISLQNCPSPFDRAVYKYIVFGCVLLSIRCFLIESIQFGSCVCRNEANATCTHIQSSKKLFISTFSRSSARFFSQFITCIDVIQKRNRKQRSIFAQQRVDRSFERLRSFIKLKNLRSVEEFLRKTFLFNRGMWWSQFFTVSFCCFLWRNICALIDLK